MITTGQKREVWWLNGRVVRLESMDPGFKFRPFLTLIDCHMDVITHGNTLHLINLEQNFDLYRYQIDF